MGIADAQDGHSGTQACVHAKHNSPYDRELDNSPTSSALILYGFIEGNLIHSVDVNI